jgi:hypothetical protein
MATIRWLIVSVTPSTTVRLGGNVVGEIHDIWCGGARTNFESGRVLVSREGRESLLEEYDRSGMSGVKVCAVRRDQVFDAGLLAPEETSSSRPGKVAAESRYGYRSGQEQWRMD